MLVGAPFSDALRPGWRSRWCAYAEGCSIALVRRARRIVPDTVGTGGVSDQRSLQHSVNGALGTVEMQSYKGWPQQMGH